MLLPTEPLALEQRIDGITQYTQWSILHVCKFSHTTQSETAKLSEAFCSINYIHLLNALCNMTTTHSGSYSKLLCVYELCPLFRTPVLQLYHLFYPVIRRQGGAGNISALSVLFFYNYIICSTVCCQASRSCTPENKTN